MDRNQAWPGEPPSQLASTSTHELFGSGAGGGNNGDEQDHYYGTDDTEQHEAIKKPARRNRNALSCAECRRLKLKCSRIWPCTSCVKRKCAHICPDDVLKEVRPSRNKEVGALQARIRELEVALSSASQSGSNYGGHRTRPASPTNASSSMHDDNASYQSYEPYNASGAADSSQHPGIQDVAEVMGTLLLGDDGSSRYLGKSAANALFHEDGSDEDEGSAGSDEDDVASSFSGRFQGGGFPMVSRGLDVEDFQAMLPPIAEAKRLVLAYYTNCAYMFEPVRRDVFDKYLAAAYNFGISDALPLEQLACVFMIIALGVSFDLEAEFRDPRSSKYHNIAQSCLTSAKFLNVPSLASIQALHLMSTWQLTTHSQTGAFRAWPLLGLAGRMVLSTGIHRDGSIWAIPEPHLTIRRQLFWELASYDRFQGLILGRPYMLNSKHFDTLMPENPVENSGESIEYHRAKWQFSLLVGELCDECLSVGRPGYDTILLHDRKIRTFKENLPAWLRFDSQMEVAEAAPEPGSREFRQMTQRHGLVVMIHETLLFLHRVAFANAIENYSSEPLRSPWAQSVVSLCLEAARTLIGVTRSAFSSYPKLAARWWHIQVHCFGAATCLAAVCIKAPASALTRLAWAELCDAVNLLESQVNEGGHARDLAPRLKRLREQAQLKLDAYQQSIISSNYPGIPSSHDQDAMKGTRNSSTSNMLESPVGPDEKASPEDEKLNILGTATRVLEGKLRQAGRSHHVGTHRPSPTGSKSVGSSSYHTSVATPTSGSGIGSVGSNSSYGAGPTFTSASNFGGQTAGSRNPGGLQTQLPGQSHSAPPSSHSSGVPIFSASTPTAQSPPFAMGKGAMPVNIGFVDQSLADLLAEVASPGQDPVLSAGSNAEDDSGMMYFTMPSGSETPNASVSGGNNSKATEAGSSNTNSNNNNNNNIANLNNQSNKNNSFVGGSGYTGYTFAGVDEFKAPRNPGQNSYTASSQSGNGGGDNRQGSGMNSKNNVNQIGSNSNSSNSGYTALPDTAVSPSSGLNFGMTDYVMGGPAESSLLNNNNNNASAGGSSFLSSIAGLLAPSPGSGITYSGYTPDVRKQQQDSNNMMGEGGSSRRDSGNFVNGDRSDNNNNNNRPSGLHLSAIMSSSSSTTPGDGSSTTPSDGGNPTTSTANGNSNSNNNNNNSGMQTSMEDSYLDTAWMDYFPTPGVGLFPQTTGLLFGNSPLNTPGIQTPNPGGNRNSSSNNNNNNGPGQSNFQYSNMGNEGSSGNVMQFQQQQQPQSRFMQQQHQHLQQQQQQQQGQNRPSGGGSGVGAYKMYDDLFGSINNSF